MKNEACADLITLNSLIGVNVNPLTAAFLWYDHVLYALSALKKQTNTNISYTHS